jgi:type II secretory pathway pseudopilin PulG
VNEFTVQYSKSLTQHRRKPKREPSGESRMRTPNPALSPPRGEDQGEGWVPLRRKNRILHSSCAINHPQKAFTLVEVMIAVAIFFMAVFAILALTSRSLQAARSLRNSTIDAGSLAAQLSLTNRLEEGIESGDFGDLYPDYSWTQSITEDGTNGLFLVQFWVYQNSAGMTEEPTLSIRLYRPDSMLRSGRSGGGRR